MTKTAGESIIAVITDFGTRDFYAGAMTGILRTIAPHAPVVDVTHNITPHDVMEASYVLARVFYIFPPGSIFLVVVDPGVGASRRNLVFEIQGRFIIAPDNGVITDVAHLAGLTAWFEIDTERLSKYRRYTPFGRTFFGRDIFAPAAGALAMGVDIEQFCTPADEYARIEIPSVDLAKNYIGGCGRYIDRYGNVLTNISDSHLDAAFGREAFSQIEVYINSEEIQGIKKYYAQIEVGKLAAVLNSWNMLEISANQARASDRFEFRSPLDIRVKLNRAPTLS
jgi:S-adenosylmethionine hydrolase